MKTPPTVWRRVVGSLFVLPLVMFGFFFLYIVLDLGAGGFPLGGLPLVILAFLPTLALSLLSLWAGLRYLCASQLLSVEDGYLVSRHRVCVGPDVTYRVRMDEVRGRTFEVQKYSKDTTDASFRPSFLPRLVLVGPRGSMLGAGVGMTMDEGVAAVPVLNQLIGSASTGTSA